MTLEGGPERICSSARSRRLRLLGQPLLLLQLPLPLPQRRQLRLGLGADLVEELHDGGRDEEGVERLVGVDREQVDEGRRGRPALSPSWYSASPRMRQASSATGSGRSGAARQELPGRPGGVGVGPELVAIARALHVGLGGGERQDEEEGDHRGGSSVRTAGTVISWPARTRTVALAGRARPGASRRRSTSPS